MSVDRDEVLRARDKTGLIIHGVSGTKHWQQTLSDPDPKVVEIGLDAIRQEMVDVKAYGGTTVLVVPAVVTKNVSYRDAYKRSQENIRKLIPDAEKHGIKIAIERSGTSSCSAHSNSRVISTSSKPLGGGLLRRRQRRRVRLPAGVDPRAWQANPQDPIKEYKKDKRSVTCSAKGKSTGPRCA